MGQKQRLQELIDQVNEVKAAKIKAEAKLDELQRRQGEIVQKLRAKGFDPDRLEEERAEREERLRALIVEAEQILNGTTVSPESAPKEAPQQETARVVASPDDIPF